MTVFVPQPTHFSAIPDFTSNPFVTGFNLTVTGNTTFTIQPGGARALTSDYVIQYPTVTPNLPAVITVNLANLGVNGVFPYLIPSAGFTGPIVLPVYIIADSAGTTNGSLNAQANQPGIIVATGNNFLPAGYDAFRRIGWILVNNTNSVITPWTQTGNGNERQYLLPNALTVLTSGNATVFTPIDLSLGANGIVPPGFSQVYLSLNLTTAQINASCFVQPFGASFSAPSIGLTSPVAGMLSVDVTASASPNALGHAAIQYAVGASNSSLTIQLDGFVDSLEAALV